MISYNDIYDNIRMCNNGKMLLCRFTAEERAVVDVMIGKNLLTICCFMVYGDAVRVAGKV